MNNSSHGVEELPGVAADPFVVSLAVFLLILMLITCTGNVLVCAAIWTRPRLQTPPYYCIFSLALADLLVGSVAMPSYLLKKFFPQGVLGEIVCDVFRFSYFLTGYASISSLSVISVERAITVTKPLLFSTIVTPARITAALVVVWLDCVLISALPFFPWEQDRTVKDCAYQPTRWWSIVVIIANVLVPFLIITVSYTCIHKIARAHSRSIRRDNTVSSSVQYKRSDKRANRTIMIIIGFFAVCWFPSCFYYFLQMVCDQCFSSSFSDHRRAVNAVVKLMTFTNSALNPLIYAWRSKEFREAYFRILLRRNAIRRRAFSVETYHKESIHDANNPLSTSNGIKTEEKSL